MPPRERCPWLNILIFATAAVQMTLLVAHVRSSREPSEKKQRVAGLSMAEIALVRSLPTERERAAAVETLRIRALGPVSRADVARSEVFNASNAPYGDRVLIEGLETCKKFRETTSPLRRMGVAGLFNTGTNYFDQVFMRNCQMPNLCGRVASENCARNPLQVVWGKHNPPSWRYSDHAANSVKDFNRTDMMPVVMIKDPLTWMRSMCARPYAARFAHSNRCPSPLQMKRDHKNVKVVFQKDAIVEYDSLLDMWSTWYQAYQSQRDPRLIVRYEDLLFRTEETVRRVCECVGGSLSAPAQKHFEFFERPAKGGKGHGDPDQQTDRAGALKKYGSKDYRYNDLTAEDIRFYNRHSPPLVSLFHYEADERRRDSPKS